MKIIIVDDEMVLVRQMKRMLEELENVEVVGSYVNPIQALLELPDSKPDAAILDIEMPGMNGILFAEKCLEAVPDIAILFATAYNNYAAEAFEANAVDYLLKPIRQERLEKAIRKIQLLKASEANRREKTTEDICIQSFGKFGVFLHGEAIKWSRAKQRELFAYLLQSKGMWVDKYRICDDLWGNCMSDQALANLQTAVWAIRKLFRDMQLEQFHIEYQGDSYILYMKNIIWDKEELDKILEEEWRNKKDGSVCHSIKRIKIKELYQQGYLYYDDWQWAVIEKAKYERQAEEYLQAEDQHL